MSYADWRDGYLSGYTMGFCDGVSGYRPDSRTPLERDKAAEEDGRRLADDDGQPESPEVDEEKTADLRNRQS